MSKARFRIVNERLTIYDVENVLKKDALELIQKLRERNPNYDIFKRSDKSLYTEFCLHKLFYKLKIFKSKSKDAGIQYPLSWYEKIAYFLLGWIGRILVK